MPILTEDQKRQNKEIGYRTHAMHAEPVQAGDDAREILASLMERQFPVEAEMARKGLHFMLPVSWAVEAIHRALHPNA